MSKTAVELRPAEEADAAAIAEIWYRGWLDSHLGRVPEELLPHRRLEDFRSRVPSRLPGTTVATLNGRVAGFVVVRDDEIEQIYLAAEARGSGVADALLRYGEQRIAERFSTAWLAVIAGNPRARRFYERNGWSDKGGFDYAAQAGEGTVPVPCRRYEKKVGR